MLVEKIRKTAEQEGLSEYQTVEFAAAFVQSLPYTIYSVTTMYDNYPRYPLETLVDNGGDCEDTSILLASIIDKMGYAAVLIVLPDHVGMGVKVARIYTVHRGIIRATVLLHRDNRPELGNRRTSRGIQEYSCLYLPCDPSPHIES